jgi:hypothetical protein
MIEMSTLKTIDLVVNLKPELKRIRTLSNKFDEHDNHGYRATCIAILNELDKLENKLMEGIKAEVLG